MATTFKNPGVLLVFNDEVWYIQTDSLQASYGKIEDIKAALVGAKGMFNAEAHLLTSADKMELSKVEAEDIRALLTRGITIRPMGR